jgi:hypothetical protein
VSEAESLPDGEAADPDEALSEVADEAFPGPPAELGVEPQDQRRIRTQAGNLGETLAGRLEQPRGLLGTHHRQPAPTASMDVPGPMASMQPGNSFHVSGTTDPPGTSGGRTTNGCMKAHRSVASPSEHTIESGETTAPPHAPDW